MYCNCSIKPEHKKQKAVCAGVWLELPSDLILESDKTRILLQNNCLVSLAKRQAAENELDSYNLEFYLHTPIRFACPKACNRETIY